MNAHRNFLMVVAVTSLLIMAIPAFPLEIVAGEESGGTDTQIKIYGEAGGGGDFTWKTIHGMVLEESGDKSDEPFNVTICEGVKYVEGKYQTTGYVYGELNEIIWYDDPEPEFTISDEDFDNHKEDDGLNLTVSILGEYWREEPGYSELRQAYKEVQITRPNNAPKAVAMIANADPDGNGQWDNWTTIKNNDHGEVVYYIDSEGLSVQFYLNASASTDEDGDNITDIRWDFIPYGSFGEESRERKMNTTVFLGEGDHTLGLIVGDGDKYSAVLDIKIIIKQPIRYPDLTVTEIQVENKNAAEDIYKGDRCAILAHVKNIGDNDTDSDTSFDVYFEYWYRDTSPDTPVWEELGSIRITETLGVNQLKLVDILWDTGIADFVQGVYSFRATADYNDEMKELREQNNMFPPEGEDKSAENITLLEEIDGGDPDISIVKVEQSLTDAAVNELVWINITLKNTGTGDARYVDIYYYVDNALQYYKTIDNLPADGTEVTEDFVFSGDTNNTSPGFRIKLEVRDDGSVIDTTDTLTVRVTGGGPKPPPPPPPNGGGEDGSGLNENIPIVILAVVIVAGLGGAGFFFMKKKDEDVW